MRRRQRSQPERIQLQLLHQDVKVGLYLRVSTEDQAQSGLGLDAQLSRGLAMAEVKGWTELPICVYRDDGISGTKDASKRPGLQCLLEDAKAGVINVVIILDLSRLGRKTRLVLNLVEELTSYGVSLISCKESLDTLTPQGQFVLTLFAAVAQLERDMIAQRTKAALDEREKIDGETGGRLPYGYQRSPDGLLVDDQQAEAIRKIFYCDKQSMSLRKIAALLNGVYPPPRGKQWWATSVREILLNEWAYRGGVRGDSSTSFPSILEPSEPIDETSILNLEGIV
jgi:site-specific DNA recombinase